MSRMKYGIQFMSLFPPFLLSLLRPQVPEQTFENNAAVCTLLYAQQYAMIRNCTLTRP